MFASRKSLLVLFVLILVVAACRHRTPVQPPPAETFEEMLFRTEYTHCEVIIAHAEGEAPNCRLLYEAFTRGRKRVTALYPQAAEIKMSAVTIYRPKRLWVEDVEYPLIEEVPSQPRGVFYPDPPFIQYSYEAVVEHEAVHFLLWILQPDRTREPAMILADPGDANNIMAWFWQIGCHGTPDDPFGQRGNRASCVASFRKGAAS